MRRITAPDEVLFDSRPLAAIPADTPNEAALAFEIPPDRLAKVNRVTLRAAIKQGTDRDNFSVGSIWLEYRNRKTYDLRYPTFERHHIGDAPGSPYKPERDCYFCLP